MVDNCLCFALYLRDFEVDDNQEVDIGQPSSFRLEEMPPTGQFDFQTEVAVNQPSNLHGGSLLEEQIVSNDHLELICEKGFPFTHLCDSC